MSTLQDKLAQLSPAQKSLLLKTMAAKNKCVEPTLTVVPRERDCLVPITSAQQRLWFLQRYGGASSLYNMPIFLRLQGQLDVLAMEKALASVLARHELLRTQFYQTDDGVFQRVKITEPFKLQIVDLTSDEMEQQYLQEQLQDIADFAFDLEQDELIQLRLVKLSQDHHVLATCVHHIITDGWSINVFMRDFAAYYQAETGHNSPALPVLPIQFADYAVWQQRRLKSNAYAEDLAFWQAYLNDAPYFLDLPSDYKRAKTAQHRGALYEFTIDANCKQLLIRLARDQQVSVFILLLSAFSILLARYSGQHQVLIGTPFAGRTCKELEDLIGYFVNSLPVKTSYSGKQSFVELLHQTQQSLLAVSRHQQVPFEKIVEAIQPQRNESYSPLFQVMFTYINETSDANSLVDLDVELIAAQRTSAKFDLTVSIQEQDQVLTGLVEFDTDLFSATSIKQMMSAYLHILGSVVVKPNLLLEQIELLSQQESQRIVYDWNNCWSEFPRQQTVHQRFQQQVEQTPDQVALVHADQQLSYQQLNKESNQLVHLLIEQGLQEGDFVALYLHRGCDLIIAMLATLKAGATYLPLDLAYPLERLAVMHQQAEIAITLTQQSLRKSAQVFGHEGILVLDQMDWQSYSTCNPPNRGYANAIAYVMFTSGSTGTPKGISIGHASIHRLVLNSNYCELKPADHIAQVSNTAFDAATFEIWGALLNGARLVIADRDISLSVEDFVGFLRDQQITVLFLTTALFNQIVQQQADAFKSLKYLLFGGELVDQEQVKKVLECGKPTQFLHVYGPTESTTFSAWHEIESINDKEITVPIGTALSNTRLYVLDDVLNPVAQGVAGELYIGGEGLSSGYINQPSETASKFVPDVFSLQPGKRMYRSGDRVRWNKQGAIEFIGRLDNQVKIRGFRIELGAIETAINANSTVKQSYVQVRQTDSQEKSLVAFLSPLPGKVVDVQALRTELQSVLPEYMVPAALVVLSDLPLNPNGKIDDKALPDPDAEDYHQNKAEIPATDTEIQLAILWQSLLGVQANRHSDFFLLGGHSLLAMQLANRIHKTFNVKLLIRDLFEHSTLSAQAKVIDTCMPDNTLALEAAEIADDYPLSFSQERLYFLQQLYPQSSAYNMLAALKIIGELDVDCLQACFDQIINRHKILSTVFVLNNARPRQKILDAQQQSIQRLDWSMDTATQQQEKFDQLLSHETNHVFNLDSLPLIRLHIVKMTAHRHLFVINNHHILSDGWSQTVFMNEWLSLYQSATTGIQAHLPSLPIQYVDYAVWQRQLLDSSRLERLLTYWREKLADMPPGLNLQTDFKRPALQTFSAQTETFSLNTELSLQLNQLAGQQHCSVFVLLLAGFHLFLARYSAQYDFALGTPVANRSHQQIENLIGFFSNTLVLRNRIDGNPLWLDFLAQVKASVINDFAHQDMPFEKLVEDLQPERDLAGTPFFQVMFLFHNAISNAPQLSDLKIEPLVLDSKDVKFDLTLAMHESNDQLHGTFEYNADLFKAERIQRMCAGFAHLLEQLVQTQHQRIGEYSIVDKPLYQQVIFDWNQTSAPTADGNLYDLFAESATGVAEKIALEQGETQLTYKQLSDQVDQLAAVLGARGAGPEVLVAVCLKRTPSLIVALLAILKSGSAYVPLDPDYPTARIEQTLEDANVLLLLTESDLVATHRELVVVPKILLDQPWPVYGPAKLNQQRPGNLAYVLYTSGSTGKPKGVAITHANAVAMISWAQTVYQPEQLSRVLVGTSICFDLSVFEIFLTLASGGTLVLLRNVIELSEQPNAAPSLINTVPSAAEQLLKANAIPESVNTINLAGEPLSADLVNKLYALPQIEKVYDLYGPSEDTTYSTYCQRQKNAQPSIGRPIRNSTAYVLDAYLQALPPGIPGELYLGGAGLARGYLGRAALTAERFIPDSFSGQTGARLYRTGDLVSHTDMGDLTYLGRLDHQVKVRGYRIELGEVEAVLKSVASVEDCVVITVGAAASSDRKLVAYVCAAEKCSVIDLQSELIQIAKQQLPGFMVPSAIIVLERLPLTANGKLDRKALPDPELTIVKPKQGLATSFVQKTLVGIWQEILGLDQAISIDDDFFELGGHSLQVLDLITQIKLTLGRELALASIFQAPTIATLSQLIAGDQQDGEWKSLVTLNKQGDKSPLFCFHPVGGHMICYNALAKALADDQPVYAFKAPGMETESKILTQLPEMAAYYLNYIMAVQGHGHYRLLGYSFGGLLAYEVARQLEDRGDTVEMVCMLDTAHPVLTAETAADTDDAELLISLFPDLGYTVEQLRAEKKSEQLTRVFDQAKLKGLIPRAMDDAAIIRYFNVCRSNLQMRYSPQTIDVPVTLVRAQQGSQRISSDDYLGWQQVSGLDINLHWVSGQHENMMEPPHIAQIAELIEMVTGQ